MKSTQSNKQAVGASLSFLFNARCRWAGNIKALNQPQKHLNYDELVNLGETYEFLRNYSFMCDLMEGKFEDNDHVSNAEIVNKYLAEMSKNTEFTSADLTGCVTKMVPASKQDDYDLKIIKAADSFAKLVIKDFGIATAQALVPVEYLSATTRRKLNKLGCNTLASVCRKRLAL